MDNFISKLNDGIDLKKVIDERLTYLLSNDYQGKRQIVSAQNIDGFFKPDEMISVFGEYGYVYNDNDIYIDLINNILFLKEKFPDKDIGNIVINAVKTTVHDYFSADKSDYKRYIDNLYSLFDGNEELKLRWKIQLDEAKRVAIAKGLDENEVLRQIEYQAREWFSPYLELSGEVQSIKKIKGLGLAKCVEYSAMTNQLLNFIGIESRYVVNSLVDKDGKDGHAYNIREGSKGPVLMDTLNNLNIQLTEQQAKELANDNDAIYDSKHNVCYGNAIKAMSLFNENHQTKSVE